MRLGYAQSVITPSLANPVFLAGFGQDRRAWAINDELFVRVAALSDGSTTIVLCALDLIGLFQSDAAGIIHSISAAKPGVKVIIAATHTHHGPDTLGLWGPDDKTNGVNPVYLGQIKEIITQTILEALALDQETTFIKTCSHQVEGVAKNARNPNIVDDDLVGIQFMDNGNNVLLTILNFPCHPEVLWEHNTTITSDYPAALRTVIEAESNAPCIFFVGALGGMMTPDVKAHSFEEAVEMGQQIAAVGLEALQKTPTQKFSYIQFHKAVFKVKMTNILFKVAIHRGLLPDMRDRRGYITTEVNLIRIQDCWLVSVPGELLPKLGLEIKQNLRAAGAAVPGIIGLANDEVGYILPKEDFHYPLNPLNPGDHYEETMSLGKQIGPRLMEAVEKLLAS